MSPEKKKQRRCDLLTTIALFLGLVFTCRLWPLLLLMMLGVFTYAIWALVENERQRAVPSPPPLLALPAPISEQELISNAFGLLQRRITEELTRDFPRAKWVWGQTGARLCFAAGDDLVILLADAEGRRSATVRTNELQFSQLLYHTSLSLLIRNLTLTQRIPLRRKGMTTIPAPLTSACSPLSG